jgi:hypothetical protein
MLSHHQLLLMDFQHDNMVHSSGTSSVNDDDSNILDLLNSENVVVQKKYKKEIDQAIEEYAEK